MYYCIRKVTTVPYVFTSTWVGHQLRNPGFQITQQLEVHTTIHREAGPGDVIMISFLILASDLLLSLSNVNIRYVD